MINFMLCNFIQADVYKAHLSDAWYQSRGKNLHRQLNLLQEKSFKRFQQTFDASNIKAIIVPHAGFNYSGELASGVYQNLKLKTFNRVIIVAPSHHTLFDGVALPGQEYFWFKSPLGHVQLDKGMLKKLQKSSTLFFCNHHVHELEHAIEVQIPFIQKYCGSCKIVPLLVGDVSFAQIQNIADILGALIDKTTLMVISSDLTHYGQTFGYVPFEHDVVANILKLDQELVTNICSGNPYRFAKILQITGVPVCGKNSILILLSIMQKKYLGDVDYHVIGYDYFASDQQENCVSYVGMIVTQEKNNKKFE